MIWGNHCDRMRIYRSSSIHIYEKWPTFSHWRYSNKRNGSRTPLRMPTRDCLALGLHVTASDAVLCVWADWAP